MVFAHLTAPRHGEQAGLQGSETERVDAALVLGARAAVDASVVPLLIGALRSEAKGGEPWDDGHSTMVLFWPQDPPPAPFPHSIPTLPSHDLPPLLQQLVQSLRQR